MNPFAYLLDRRVRAVWVESESQRAMRLDLGWNETIYIDTYADCCSETWFADVIGVQNLVGQDVRGIETLSLPEPQDGRTRQEYDQAYGVRLTTAKGYCDIVYRNSSNGYYGGHAMSMDAEQGQGMSWTPITEDWQA